MVFIGAVEPAAEDTGGYRVEEGELQLLCHDLCVVFGQDDERGLAKILVTDSNFARNNVGQGVDKSRRTREETFLVLYSGLIGSVGLQ